MDFYMNVFTADFEGHQDTICVQDRMYVCALVMRGKLTNQLISSFKNKKFQIKFRPLLYRSKVALK